MRETIKKIGIIIIVLIILALCTMEPAEPQTEMIPYMSDIICDIQAN